MKAIGIELSGDVERIEIMPIADNHWSDPHSDHKKIMADLEYIESHDDVYCILNGDLMDCAIESSIGDTYGATLTPMQELQTCVRLFKPLADKGKILCVVPGNHERRHYRTNGLDITALMCKQLGIEKRYSDATALLFLRLGRSGSRTHNRKYTYTIHVSHGSGGGRKEGGKIQRLVDLSTIVDADIYVCGHTHLPAGLKVGYFRPCLNNNSVAEVTKLFVNTSAALKYGGYGEDGGYRPACTDTPVIWLSGTEKKMNALI